MSHAGGFDKRNNIYKRVTRQRTGLFYIDKMATSIDFLPVSFNTCSTLFKILINDKMSEFNQLINLCLGWLHDKLPKSILPSLTFYPMSTYPMLFDLFVQLSDYR